MDWDEEDALVAEALLAINPDWETLEWLDAGGAMAIAGLAMHCRATSPQLTVHVKVYLPAEPSGEKDYRRQGSPERIARLYQRFQDLRTEEGIASVPIHGLHHSEEGLIVIMECVRTIESLLAKDPQGLRTETPRALRELDTHQQWLHFDICPKNVGKTSDGTFCYVDLESLYRVGVQGAAISEAMTKVDRVWPQLYAELAGELQSDNGVSPELANRFQNHQLARLAMDMFASRVLAGNDLATLAKQEMEEPDLWDEHFVQPIERGEAPDLGTLANAIEDCLSKGKGENSPMEA